MVYEDFIEISCKALPEIVCYIGTPSYSNPGQTGHLSIPSQVKRDTFLYHLRSKGTPSLFCLPRPSDVSFVSQCYLYKKIELKNGEISSHASSFVI
jgi:hypothetical protein